MYVMNLKNYFFLLSDEIIQISAMQIIDIIDNDSYLTIMYCFNHDSNDCYRNISFLKEDFIKWYHDIDGLGVPYDSISDNYKRFIWDNYDEYYLKQYIKIQRFEQL